MARRVIAYDAESYFYNFAEEIRPLLAAEGIVLLRATELTGEQKGFLQGHGK